MLFNSFAFAGFFAAVLLLHAALPHRARNRMLLAASYLFYASWDWRFLSLILLSTFVDFAVGIRLGGEPDPKARRRWVVASLVVNLGILGAFKYADFFATGLVELAGRFGLAPGEFALDVVLPVGISFYTFQTLSYSLDVYRRRIEPVRDPVDFALFVAFFPQLVAGPIERAARLLPQIQRPRPIEAEDWNAGGWLVLWGLFKKVVVADNLASLVDAVYAPTSAPTGAEVWLATYAFAFQIYCDFSGYTDIARGTARMLGFDLMRNFALPYFSASPAEFWRRWHISLSTWLRDYLYISLGGNRHGRWRTARNLAVTMVLGGLWHGAAWTYVCWGAFHGALLIVHRAARPQLERLAPRGGVAGALWSALAIGVTFHLICLGWLLFRAESLAHAGALLGALAGASAPDLESQWLLPLLALVGPVIAVQLVQSRARDAEPSLLRMGAPLRVALQVALFFGIVLLGEDFGEPFLYFQF